MKLAIMQPYLFPYIGYFQLISAVDKFIIGDDYQYIKQGWINRNRFLISRKEKLITFSVKKDSSYSKIKERYFVDNIKMEFKNFLGQIYFSYKEAPSFKESFNLLEEILSFNERNVALFVVNSLRMICNYLKIETPFYHSMNFLKGKNFKKQKRIFQMAETIGANHFINSIGGIELYSKEEFKKNGIKLSFLKTKEIKYKQFDNKFVPNLSIIDVMMFNSPEEISDMLNQYELI